MKIRFFIAFLCGPLSVISQQQNKSECEYIEINRSNNFSSAISCDTVKVLAVRLWDYSGAELNLPKANHFELIAVEGGNIFNQFLHKYATNIDSLYYHENDSQRNILLENVCMRFLSLFFESKVDLTISENVNINHLKLRGVKINLKTAKQLLKIMGLNKIECFNFEITKKARGLLVQRNIEIIQIAEN